MDQGRIVEQGNHDELMGRQGLYYSLYNSQFSGVAT
jgi:ATP-binding cassette subfamily B protein